MSIDKFRPLFASIILLGLVLGVPAAAAAQQAGTVAGTVTDQNTGQPVAGARVQVRNTNIAAITNAEGRYTLRNVPAGTHGVRVSVIGFASVSQSVTVDAGGIATADFALRQAVVSLDAVVVTATGEERARALGNAVSQIDAASITERAPISNFADLLSGRASNVQVLPSSGTTGTGARIRIRGLSSFSLSNEPVYYVDGVRVESGSNSFSIGTGGMSFSRINDINPEEIESIEIIKGPSAATLYGTQAANGVVRITTKRGVAGRPVWNVYSEAGVLNDNNTYPTNYFSWGRLVSNGNVTQCLLFQSAAGTCAIDSLTSFNVLQDERTSPYGTGWRGQLGAQVSGGSEQVRYFFSAEYEDEIGHLRLPDEEYSRIAQLRVVDELPYEHYRPNEVKKVSVRSNVNANVSSRADVGVSIGVVTSAGRLPQNDNNVTGMLGSGLFGRGYEGTRAFGREWGFFRPGEVFSVVADQDITRLTGSSSANWRPTEYLTARATVGLDYTHRIDGVFQALNEGPAFLTFARGRRSDNRFELAQTTVDLGATASFPLNPDLTSKTSGGVQYLRDWSYAVFATGNEFPPGGKTVSFGAIKTAGEATAEAVTLGFYVDQVFGWRDRLFLTTGLRHDFNSAFGADARSATYPKVQASWVISDEDFFPVSLPLSNVRLRTAWGASGVQPGTTDALRTLFGVTATLAGSDAPGLVPGAPGNSTLKPERSSELEVGMDADFLGGSGHIELTYYAKKTSDALVNRILPPSIGSGSASRVENLGSTRNRGFEGLVTVSTNITPSVGLDVTVSGSRNVGKLLSLGDTTIQSVGAGVQRQVPGYPLFGYWDRPIRSFNDANGDGIIVLSEIVVGDTAEFLGPSLPQTEIAVNAGLSLFSNRLRLSGQLDYRGDFLQNNFTDYFRCTSSAANNCHAINVPGAPLADQAAAVAGRNGATGFTAAGYLVDGSFLALRELSLTFNAPETWAQTIRGQRLSMTLTGRNLAKWTSYPGIDPEVNGVGQSDFQRDFLTQPPITHWTFRVNVGF